MQRIVLLSAFCGCVVSIINAARCHPPAESAASVLSNWPCWRGPTHDNHSRDTNPPVEWTVSSNIVWRADVPGRGHASPCVVGNRIFIASADDSAPSQFVLCYRREDGQQLWRTELHHRPLPPIHGNNSHASATPAADGQAVYTAFVSGGELTVSAISHEGKIRWQQSAGSYEHANGFGASPVLFEHLVIVASDNQQDPAIVAFDCHDGHVVWRTPRPKSDNSATPIVARVADRPQLLLNGARLSVGYDPLTGNELWHVNHNTVVAACTMAFDENLVFASGNVPEKLLLCVRADGSGDVGTSHVVWRTNQLNTYVPSPLIVGQWLYAVTDTGLAWCREAATGEVVWKDRLEGTFFSSPVLAADRIYATNDAGVTHVLRVGPKFERLAANDIGEACMATPAFCGDHIYLRTSAHMFCIGRPDSR